VSAANLWHGFAPQQTFGAAAPGSRLFLGGVCRFMSETYDFMSKIFGDRWLPMLA
jgi:hypothetical protein